MNEFTLEGKRGALDLEPQVVELETLDQQIAVFGTQDEYARLIEQAFAVSICLYNNQVEVSGESEEAISCAVSVLQSLLQMYRQGELLDRDLVCRLLESAREGNVDASLQAMSNVVITTYRGQAIKCKTLGQKNYVKAMNDHTVTLCIGPAGTGKTYLAVAHAIAEFKRGNVERIIMSRPAIEAGEERLGFLPGDLTQKVDPYLRPLYDALNDLLGSEQAKKYQERGIIEIAPLAYMRGRTLNHAVVLIDESQNASFSTLKMALTRIGEGSRMVLTGDVTQIDLPRQSDSGLEKCAAILRDVEDIAIVRLDNRDVVRNKIVKDIIRAFEKEEQRQQTRKTRISGKKNGKGA